MGGREELRKKATVRMSDGEESAYADEDCVSSQLGWGWKERSTSR